MSAKKDVLAYQRVVKAIWELINEHYDDGGWLPSGREMAKRLNVSHNTYCKALKLIQKEGAVHSFSPKGHYVSPVRIRLKKIGIIMSDGAESSFVHAPEYVSAAIQYLYEHGFYSHMIESPSTEQLYDNAKPHALRGLLWFNPPPHTGDVLKVIMKEGQFPLVVINATKENVANGEGLVTFDSDQIDRKRVEFMLGRGHKRIAYIGKYKRALTSGMVDILEKNGVEFTSEYCVANMMNDPKKITDLVKNKYVTGIISEGGILIIDLLFTELSRLPEKEQPEVVIPKYHEYSRILQAYPKIKLVDTSGLKLTHNLGAEAAKMMITHLENDKPLRTIKIGYEA